MSSIVISGDTSGAITLAAPNVSGSTTIDLPATAGTMLNTGNCGVCRAWVNFNGTGTVAIRASYNVSSITDNGVGDYVVNFTNALPDANYSAQVSCGGGGDSPSLFGAARAPSQANPTTSAYQFRTVTTANNVEDKNFVSVAIFR